MKLAAALILPLLAGCTSLPVAEGASPILHYLRSNRDGSEPEHVVQYRPTRETIAVYKWVSKCTTAAYVTATMDRDIREGRSYVAGKVAPNGGQARFGTLALDAGAPALVVAITPPGAQPITARHPLRSRPFILFDFDFADLNSFLQVHRPRSDFTFELPVIWPGEPNLFRDLGKLNAAYAGEEVKGGRRTRRFDLRIDGPAPSTGALWVDAAAGFIVEAQLGLPNHDNYRDFRLRLERVQQGSRSAWDALTASHYADCPTGN